MRSYSHKGIYRSRKGAIFGVCRGLAEYFDFSVFWVRTIAVILLVFTGLWPVTVLYILAALVMKPEPARPFPSVDEQEPYAPYMASRHEVAQRLKRRYEDLEDRIQRMEDVVTSREYDWDRRFGR
jgi:phage shock protein C